MRLARQPRYLPHRESPCTNRQVPATPPSIVTETPRRDNIGSANPAGVRADVHAHNSAGCRAETRGLQSRAANVRRREYRRARVGKAYRQSRRGLEIRRSQAGPERPAGWIRLGDKNFEPFAPLFCIDLAD